MSVGSERETPGPSAYTASVANSLMGRSMWGRMRMRQMLRLRERPPRHRAPADTQLTQRRPLYFIAGLLMLASALTSYALLFICGLLLLGIAIVPELWYRYGLRGLVVSREIESSHINFGEVVTVSLTVENRKLLPLPMVETEDEIPEALTVLGARLSLSAKPGTAMLSRGLRLWTFQRVRRRYYLRGAQRGAYAIGPTLMRVTDPFGIMTRDETRETTRALLVRPLVAPLERFGLTPRAIFGDHASQRRLLEDPLRVAGIRDYVPGDDPRRVHWKATARLGALQSKLLDPSTQRTLLIALDVRTFNRAQLGYDPDLAELGISAAASVAAWAVERGYAVGLVANGSCSTIAPDPLGRIEAAPRGGPAALTLPRLRLEPAARPEQLSLILDGLARVILFGGAPMAPLLTSEMRMAPTGATLVYVGLESLVDVATMIALRRIQMNGHAVSLVLTTRDSDDPFAEEDESHNLHATALPRNYIGGRARWRALVAEAVGDTPARHATDAPDDAQLAAERALIATRRNARKARQAPRQEPRKEPRKEEQSHAEAEQRHDDGAQPTAPHDSALALP